MAFSSDEAGWLLAARATAPKPAGLNGQQIAQLTVLTRASGWSAASARLLATGLVNADVVASWQAEVERLAAIDPPVYDPASTET